MPAIPIHPPTKTTLGPDGGAGLPQLLRTPSGYAIVEIQGTLNASGAASTADGVACPVGKIVFPHYRSDMAADDTSWHKRVYLYVGKHQRLTGEVKKLPKPMAVLRKREAAGETDGGESELEIAEIVYYKLLFAHRPEPVGGGGG